MVGKRSTWQATHQRVIRAPATVSTRIALALRTAEVFSGFRPVHNRLLRSILAGGDDLSRHDLACPHAVNLDVFDSLLLAAREKVPPPRVMRLGADLRSVNEICLGDDAEQATFAIHYWDAANLP